MRTHKATVWFPIMSAVGLAAAIFFALTGGLAYAADNTAFTLIPVGQAGNQHGRHHAMQAMTTTTVMTETGAAVITDVLIPAADHPMLGMMGYMMGMMGAMQGMMGGEGYGMMPGMMQGGMMGGMGMMQHSAALTGTMPMSYTMPMTDPVMMGHMMGMMGGMMSMMGHMMALQGSMGCAMMGQSMMGYGMMQPGTAMSGTMPISGTMPMMGMMGHMMGMMQGMMAQHNMPCAATE